MKKKRVLIYVLTGVLLIYFVGMLVSQQRKIKELKETIEELQVEIEETKKESEILREENANAETREMIEKFAREFLGLVYPGELVFVDSNG